MNENKKSNLLNSSIGKKLNDESFTFSLNAKEISELIETAYNLGTEKDSKTRLMAGKAILLNNMFKRELRKNQIK